LTGRCEAGEFDGAFVTRWVCVGTVEDWQGEN